MKKVRLLTPLGEKEIVFNTPKLSLKSGKNTETFLKILRFLGLGMMIEFFMLLPFAQYFTSASDTTETSAFKYFLIIVFIAGIFFATAILNNQFVDPEGFIYVLVFNLLVTLSSVIATSSKVSNTFGTADFRGLAGITSMVTIGIYYFISYYLNSKELFRKAMNILLSGLILFDALLIIKSNETKGLINQNLVLLFIAMILVFAKLLKITKYKMIAFIGFALLFVLTIASIDFSADFYKQSFIIVFAGLLAIIPIYLLFFINKRKVIKERISWVALEVRKIADTKKLPDYLDNDSFTKEVLLFVLLIAPILMIAFLIFAYSKDSTVLNFWFEQLKNYQTVIATLGGNVKYLIFGLSNESFQSGASFIQNILAIYGLLSLAAFIIIWGYAIIRGRTVLVKSFKSQDFKYVAALLYIVILVPILSVFIYPGITVLIFWWAAFSLLLVYDKAPEKYDDSKSYRLAEIRLKNPKLKLVLFYGKIVLSIVLVVLSFFLVGALYSLVK